MDLKKIGADLYNKSEGKKSLLNCDKCKNKGYIMTVDADGYAIMRECECMKARRILKNQAKSGLSELLKKCTFDSFKITNILQETSKKQVQEFSEHPNGWLVVSGRSGTGKTHLCIATVGKLLNDGRVCKYMMWRDEIPKLKAIVNDVSYEREMEFLKTVDVLYIDDFFKGSVTQADVNLAFELINHRSVKELTTIISTELSINNISEVDGAIAGRIIENSVIVSTLKGENYRFRNIKERIMKC